MSLVVPTEDSVKYENRDTNNKDELLIDFDKEPDPELSPEIMDILKPYIDRGYKPEDRNDILNLINIGSEKITSRYRSNSSDESEYLISKSPPLDIPRPNGRTYGKTYSRNPYLLPVDINKEKEMESMREIRNEDESLISDKKEESPYQEDSIGSDDDLLFKMEPGEHESYDEPISDYFEV